MIEYLSLKEVTARHLREIQEAVAATVESGRYLQGGRVEAFETAYARYIGTPHCIACGNGLDALSLIFRAYKESGFLHEGDEIIVPANTYIASILSITECGLKPVPVEPDIRTLQIDDRLIADSITERTKAVLLVHLYGRCAYTETIGELCKRHCLKLIEDNAQAHGCTHRGRHTGALGDAAAHSFYPGKNLGALGDAGAVTTADGELAAAVRALANYGSSRKYVFPYKGVNSRMDELQAAVLSVKLNYLDEENSRRKTIAKYYEEHICNGHIRLPEDHRADNVYHIFPVFCHHRDRLQQWLQAQGIGTMIHYPIPPHKQECYREWNDRSYPVTEEIHRTELSIPCNQTMSSEEVMAVVEALNGWKGSLTPDPSLRGERSDVPINVWSGHEK